MWAGAGPGSPDRLALARGHGSFLDKVDFLQRTDERLYERELEARNRAPKPAAPK